jgi:ATP-dependent protease HslVU (ClpYQ) peptidase subunit
MTTIIGVEYDDKCVILADNQVTDDGGRKYSHPDMAKISEVGPLLIAGSGEVSPCDIAQHMWNPPRPTAKDKDNLYHFMISKVMPSLRKCLEENGYNFDAEHDKSKDGLRFQFIMACGGELFDIDQDLSVMRSSDGIYGIGSGAAYALGAIHAGAKPMKAMEIAAKISAFTSGPYIQLEQVK